MAIDALSLPYDITWQRVAWQADMLDRGYDNQIPPKWRSSISAYAYAVPLAETVESYPDHRVVYVKVTTTITGWSPRESLGEYLKLRDPEPSSPDNPSDGYDGGGPVPTEDDLQQDGWNAIDSSEAVGRNYWPCGAALLQVSIFPNPETGVADNDYPSILDVEPKKRELYEAVTETGEVLNGSRQGLNIAKGNTSSHSVDASANLGFAHFGASVSYGYETTESRTETTDSSTERRETSGRSTQLSQMYQLFNAYHVGTNRAVFLSFPRPHIVSSADQIENSLANGERGLEGIQDVFLIVLIPKTVSGFCVRAGLDTSHKTELASGRVHYVTTRRSVRGCGTFQDDRITPVAPPANAPRPRPIVVDEGIVDGWRRDMPTQIRSGRAGRLAVADALNLGTADLRRAILGTQAAGKYKPRHFASTSTFAQILSLEMRTSALTLDKLITLGHLSATEKADLGKEAITSVAELFAETDPAKLSELTATIRTRLVAAIASTALPEKA